MSRLPVLARRAAPAVLAVGLAVVALHLLPRLFYDDVVWALNGWFVPYDLVIFLRAGDAVLAGESPYPALEALVDDTGYVYPPLVAVLAAPLAALPAGLAAAAFAWLSVAAILGALWLLGVRDWRCHALALLSPLAHEAMRWGTLGPFLLLLVAAVWRWREAPLAAGAAAAGAAAAKLFLWPLGLWLALTGRLRALAAAVGAGVAAVFLSWAVIGFAGLADYPALLRELDSLVAAESYSVYALGRTAGLPAAGARGLAVLVGLVLLALALRAARSGRDRDRRSLTLALAAALALSPVVWLHYLLLLYVPIALARPRLAALWLAPLALWPFQAAGWLQDWPAGDVAELALVTTLTVAILAATLVPRLRLPALARRASARAEA